MLHHCHTEIISAILNDVGIDPNRDAGALSNYWLDMDKKVVKDSITGAPLHINDLAKMQPTLNHMKTVQLLQKRSQRAIMPL